MTYLQHSEVFPTRDEDSGGGAATAGDDYEIAFTAPPSARSAIADAARAAGVAVSEMVRVEPGAGVALIDEAGQALGVTRAGFTHF